MADAWDDDYAFLPDLHRAAKDGDLARVQALVTAGDDIDEEEEAWNQTPLLYAAQEGHVKVVQYLVKCGANKEASGSGCTALYVAAMDGHLAVVQILVEHGADWEYIAGGTTGLTPLVIAALGGHFAVVDYLLELGCNIEHSCFRGTALHVAAEGGYLEIAHLLMRKGANVRAKTFRGEVPSDRAMSNGHHATANAIRAEMNWTGRRMAMFVAYKSKLADGAKQPLLALLRSECPDVVKHVVAFL